MKEEDVERIYHYARIIVELTLEPVTSRFPSSSVHYLASEIVKICRKELAKRGLKEADA